MKRQVIFSCLLSLTIVSCTSPILNNTSQYSDLDQEYSQFKTEALTQSYLKKKMDKWLSDSKYSKNLVREIEYAKFKHKDLLKDIVASQPTIFDSITGNTGVSQKRSEPSFENYIEYIDPYPSSVTANNATSITSTGFTANWTSVSNATGYKLYLDGSATPITLGLVSSYNITGLPFNTSHSYIVKAINSAGTSQSSNTINVTLVSSTPVATSASSVTQTSFIANWASVTGATGYKLYLDGSATPITLGLVNNYSVTGLSVASSHNYYVVATNSSGDSANSNTISVQLLINVPSTPVSASASSITQTSYTANWGTASGATGYKLYLDGSPTPIILGLVTSYSVSNLSVGSSHSYYVVATNSGGDSGNSNLTSLTLLTNAPVANAPTNLTQTSYTANWSSITAATGYKLYLDGSVTPITLGTVTTYDVSGLTLGTSHSYYVKAILNAGDSPASNTISFYTSFDEFQISASFETGIVDISSVAVGSDGRFVFAWGKTFNQYDVYTKRYDFNGVSLGSQYIVNSYNTGDQTLPSIGMASDGTFVIAWSGRGSDDSTGGIYVQRYNSDGTKNGSEFRVNTYTTNTQDRPSIAVKSDGSFVISWESMAQDGDISPYYNIYAQRFNTDGSKAGSEFKVNTYTTNSQINPATGIASDGSFVISWQGEGSGDTNGIFAQKYNSDGSTNGSEFKVNTYTAGKQERTSIAVGSDGRFVISWKSEGQDGDLYGIYAQKYNSDGSTNGSEFRVNTTTAGSQENPSLGMASDGTFVIAWQSYSGVSSIYAQRFNTDGTKNGSQFKINTNVSNNNFNPSLRMAADGRFVATWESVNGQGSGAYFGKRYDKNGNVL